MALTLGNLDPNTNFSSQSAVLHRSLHNDPHRVVSAQGNYLTLSNGQKILDATGGAAVSCLGHGNERVKKAMMKQMDEVSYCHSLFFSTTVAEELAQELIDSTNGKMSRAFIVNSGTYNQKTTNTFRPPPSSTLYPVLPKPLNP